MIATAPKQEDGQPTVGGQGGQQQQLVPASQQTQAASTPLALVGVVNQAVAQATAAATVTAPQPTVASSTTHRKEYMAFLRAANHPQLWKNLWVVEGFLKT